MLLGWGPRCPISNKLQLYILYIWVLLDHGHTWSDKVFRMVKPESILKFTESHHFTNDESEAWSL